jgi:hypothetical protein
LPKRCFCAACFNAHYPIPIPETLKVSKFSLEEDGACPPKTPASKPTKARTRK